jgi:nucleoid-associated protein YgaU
LSCSPTTGARLQIERDAHLFVGPSGKESHTMRKDVTLGMTIGGGLLAVALVGVIAVSHKGSNRHGGVETTSLMNNGGAGDVGGADNAATPDQATPKPQQDEKPAAAPKLEEKPAAKPAKGTKDTQLAKADAPKDDPITRALFTGGSGTALLSTTQTPDANASSAGGNNDSTPGAGDAQPEHKAAPAGGDELPPHIGPGIHSVNKPEATKHTAEAKTSKPAPADDQKATEPAPVQQHESQQQQPATRSGGVAKAHTHKVQKGETFSTIAAAAYGSANYYPYIMRANPNVNARALKPGTELVLPDVSEVKGTGTTTTGEEKTSAKGEAIPASFHKTAPAPLDATKEYKVVAGDSLNRIAIRLYGKQDMTQKLYEANRSTIGDNPAAIKVGMVLKLPQPPVVAATTSAR